MNTGKVTGGRRVKVHKQSCPPLSGTCPEIMSLKFIVRRYRKDDSSMRNPRCTSLDMGPCLGKLQEQRQGMQVPDETEGSVHSTRQLCQAISSSTSTFLCTHGNSLAHLEGPTRSHATAYLAPLVEQSTLNIPCIGGTPCPCFLPAVGPVVLIPTCMPLSILLPCLSCFLQQLPPDGLCLLERRTRRGSHVRCVSQCLCLKDSGFWG